MSRRTQESIAHSKHARSEQEEEEEARSEYLSELLKLASGSSSQRVQKEPEKQKLDQGRLERRLLECAQKHYKAFIKADFAKDEIEQRSSEFERTLVQCKKDFELMKKRVLEFASQGERCERQRALLLGLNAKVGDLNDLLEIPKVQEQCGRNGNFDEALDLELYVERLRASLPDVPVIDDLREASRASNKRTLAKLLKRLEDQIQLPECLRVVGHLRRSRYFDTETSLRRAFLARREIFVKDACEDASRWLAPYERAKKLTDVHRVHVFDVVTQYRAIFSDDVDDSDGVTTTSNNNSNVSTITVTANESMVLLSAWASQRAESYRSALDESLARIDEGGALASVFEHCEYCGNSLARVGVETRPLLRDIFEKHALRIFEDALGAASEAFEKSLSTHRWTTYLGFTASSSEQEQESKNKTGDDAETNNNNTNEFAPPQSLLEHAPVAAFVNGVLAAFNEVRLLSPKLKSCRKPFAKALRKTFENGKTLLKNEERAILKTGSETKKEAWSSAWTSLESCAAPYCAKCFDKLLRLDADCDGRTASALLASLSI